MRVRGGDRVDKTRDPDAGRGQIEGDFVEAAVEIGEDIHKEARAGLEKAGARVLVEDGRRRGAVVHGDAERLAQRGARGDAEDQAGVVDVDDDTHSVDGGGGAEDGQQRARGDARRDAAAGRRGEEVGEEGRPQAEIGERGFGGIDDAHLQAGGGMGEGDVVADFARALHHF